MWSRVNIPLGIENSVKNIFGALLIGGIDRSNPANAQLLSDKKAVSAVARRAFSDDIPFNIFWNTYAIFYEILVTLQVKSFTLEQLETIIENNKDLILNSPYIDTARYSITAGGNIATDDDILTAITYSIKESFIELSNLYVTEEEYSSSCTIYRDWYKNAFCEFTALNMATIMSDHGYECKKPNKRKRIYQGPDDMQEYYNESMRIIRSLSPSNRITTTVVNESWLANKLNNQSKQDQLSLFTVGLKEIDDYFGDLRRGNMLGILGPTKGGKTKFANYLAQRALSLGYNVCVWPLEGTQEEWESMQTSCLIAQSSYEALKKSGKPGSMIRISSKDILERKYLNSPEIKKQVASAQAVMAIHEKYGRLSFIKGPGYLEDFLDILESHWETENRFDVLIIDSLVNITSKRGKDKVSTISEAYMQTKTFLANTLRTPALGIVPAQLKQTAVDFLRKNPDETIDVTAGGESAETIRTPDYNIGLFSTKEERAANIMKMYCVASRHTDAFPDFQARCFLDCCYFLSKDDEIRSAM